MAARLSRSCAATSPTRRSSAPLVAEADAVVNFAAESHVDRSILDPEAFLRDRRHRRPRPARGVPGRARPAALPPGLDRRGLRLGRRRATPREDAPLAPRSPYAAAKAAGELLVRSYVVTHGVDAVVTRGSNTYGPYHHPEKLIPLFITNALDDRPLPLYGDGLQRRDWLYVADHAGGDRLRPAPRRGGRDLQRRRAAPRWTNRDVVAAAPRAPRQAVVAGPPGRGPARATTGATRWTARSSRRSAGARGPRSRTAWPRRSTGSGANEAWWRAARSGDWDAYYERQYGRAARPVPRRRPPPTDPPADARRRHRAPPAGSGARSSTALADAPFTGPAGPIAWDRDGVRPRRPGTGRGAPRPRPARGRRPRRGLDRRRRLRPRSGPRRCARNGVATGVLADGLRRARDRPASSSRRTRSSTGGARTAAGTRRPIRPAPAQPVRRLEARPASGCDRRLRGADERRPARPPRDRPDGLAVRAARARLPAQDPRGGRPRAAAAGEPLRVVGDEWGTPTYAADVADAIVGAARRGRASPGSITSSTG